MMNLHIKTTLAALALAVALAPARADDAFKVAVGQINNWENQMPTLGQDAGIFKKHGLALDNFGTAGAGETMQPIIGGSADIGIGVGVAGVMRVFSRGAPVRVLLPAFTGTGDLYWYVRADSPLKSLKDTTSRIRPKGRARTISWSPSRTRWA
jgi:NitT/TauT family transport system substrate-binding protein